MQSNNFITSEHDVNRRRLRPWTVYELATTCPERYVSTGHMKLNGSMTRKYNIHKLKNIIRMCPCYSKHSAMRQFLFAKDFAERGWHRGRANLEGNWYPRELSVSVTRIPADACATLCVWKEVLIGVFSSVSRTREFRKNVRHRDSPRQRSHQCQAREAARNSAPHLSWVSAGFCIRPITAIAAAANRMKGTRRSTWALTVSSGMSRRTRGGNGASARQAVKSFLLQVGPWQGPPAGELQYYRISKTVYFRKQ